MQAEGTGRIGELTRRGVAASVALARKLGLPADEPVVLSSRGNLLVHLAPAPVVARVATLSAWSRSNPAEWLAREIAVAGYVAGRGGPVVPPASAVDPGPHGQDGFTISMWQYVPPSGREPSPAEAGAALAQLHLAAQGCPAELGEMSPVRELITEGLAVLERDSVLDAAMLAALRAVHAEVVDALAGLPAESQVLHGDAHAGNLIAVGAGGWAWTDLEETCRGPADWDLAVLARHSAEPEAALRGYAAVSGTAAADPDALAPFRRARELEGAVWTLCMAQLYPARYADRAPALLAAVLAG